MAFSRTAPPARKSLVHADGHHPQPGASQTSTAARSSASCALAPVTRFADAAAAALRLAPLALALALAASPQDHQPMLPDSRREVGGPG